MALMAVMMCLGLLFYILLGFRYTLNPKPQNTINESELCGFVGP